ncbi:PEP-CTERM sorting domain-containing protein [Oscillatoria salina]|uniref:PEP-CTERM sorting domain-containing protein n=1 Tax=Oscillatoria salina TaxID=331517 RepID=UPI0013B65624|nr:PEP-CTERM sorting domain-containing protein [Oscillatoria salina]MBZ8181622.1 PEP-CTERM sorting domain-containing protein [Oscillatoria salina IIICB1]NET89954.1 PEP-CTERM sorting domain-containing protein [Kamptonema sp. SIO1D9]
MFNKGFIALSLATVGLAISSAAANAITFELKSDWNRDTEFIGLINSGEFKEEFVAESRIGDSSGNATYEVGLLDFDNNNLPVAQSNYGWTNGEAVDFTLELNGGLLNYTVGNKLLSSQAFSGDLIEDLLIRARSSDNSTMSLVNLALNGVSLPDLIANPGEVKYLEVGDLATNFTLTGTSIMSWTGDRPRNSHLAYQIKAGVLTTNDDIASVPEPATISLLSLGVVGTLLTRTRRRKQDA